MTVDELIGAQLPDASTILKDINFTSLQTQAAQQRALKDKLAQLGINTNQATINVSQTTQQIEQQVNAKLVEFRQQAIDQTRQELSQRFGVPITSRETVHQLLVDVIGLQFDRYVRRFVNFVPALLALALFFILRFATSLFQAVVVWSGWLFLKLYRLFRFVRIAQQTVQAEKVEWET